MARSREEKYPNTDTFFYYNANPKGRITGDCSIRARCTALDEEYNKTLTDAVQMQIETGYAMDDVKGIARHMERRGWEKHIQPRKADNTKYTGAEFCKLLDKWWDGSPVLCNIGGHHIVCIKQAKHWDGLYHYKVHDIWDSSRKCIGNWWSKSHGSDIVRGMLFIDGYWRDFV